MKRQGKNVVEKSTAKLVVPIDDLQKEVSEFASQLGLASGTANGFNDSDFRPEVAKKAISSKGKGRQGGNSRKGEERDDVQLQQRLESSQHAGPSGRTNIPRNRTVDAINARKWKSGSGIRPGEKAGKTLVGKDEPSIWHEALSSLASLPLDESDIAVDEWALERLRNEAEAALANEAKIFEQDLGRKNQADSRWLQQVKQSGTTADKLAALTLLVQESAIANLRSLDELLKWVGKRSGARAVAAQAIDALKELFTTCLLPNRKLNFFEQQPLASLPAASEGRHYLLYFYLEDAIKKRYLQFTKDLQEASRDNLAFIKEKAIKAIYDLLRSKPEQEALLLSALVDKLGDPSRKVASTAGYLLGQLLEEHPAMSLVVVQETERFLFKPYTSAKAVYHAVVFLNQIVLTKRRGEGGSAVAKMLIGIYFTLFKLILQGKVGQAFELQTRKDAQEVGKGGKGGKSRGKQKKEQRQKGNGSQNKTGHAKQDHLLPQTPASQVASIDAKLLGALLAGVRRAFPFVDPSETEALMEEHSAALFKITHTATFGVAVQALSLVFQLLDARSAVSDRFYRALYGLLLHPELAKSNKSAMCLSLLFKAMRADVSLRRILAFIKRLLQMVTLSTQGFGSLRHHYLLTAMIQPVLGWSSTGTELHLWMLAADLGGHEGALKQSLQDRPSLWTSISQGEEADDQLEHFQDEGDEPSRPIIEKPQPQGMNFEDDDEMEPEGSPKTASGQAFDVKPKNLAYDMQKRDPKFSGAEHACIWELVLLANHVHPSVAAMAKALLAGVPIDYAGDPVRDMSTSAFLDKFIQKKPKVQPKGSSLMQPFARQSLTELSTPAFAALSAADAAPDTAYFHKFFEVKAQREAAGVRPKGKSKKRAKDIEVLGSDDDSSVDSDAASEEIDEFLENAEDSDGEGATGDYAQLAAAMEFDGDRARTDPQLEESAGEEGKGAGDSAESESDIDEMDTIIASSDSNTEESVPEEVDAFQLAGPSEESESLDGASSMSDSEWIMAETSYRKTDDVDDGDDVQEEDNMHVSQGRRPSSKNTVRSINAKVSRQDKSRSASKGKKRSVFASAEDYAQLLSEDSNLEKSRKRSKA